MGDDLTADDIVAELQRRRAEIERLNAMIEPIDVEDREAKIDALNLPERERLEMLLDLARDRQIETLMNSTGELMKNCLQMAERIVLLEAHVSALEQRQLPS